MGCGDDCTLEELQKRDRHFERDDERARDKATTQLVEELFSC